MATEKKTILIVDDTPDNITLLNQILRPQYNVKAATNGKGALIVVHKNPPPDLILLDIMMPGMDGFELCRILKDDKKTENIPVIFITGKDDVLSHQRGKELGAAGYLKKPINAMEIKSQLHREFSSGI